jgi:transcriptional regulator with XRE-family HTH domain
MQLSLKIAGRRPTVNATPSPLVQRRRLRTELRRARIAADLTQEQVADAMDWHPSKIIRIESGAVAVSTNDLKALLRLYEIGDPERADQLVELARGSRQPSWVRKYRADVSTPFLEFVEYEETASVVCFYDPLLIPGLFQTSEYAHAIIRTLSDPGTPPERLRARLKVRLTRQELLERPHPPTVMCVLDEAAILRAAGERTTAPGQIRRLIELSMRPNITINMVPFSAGLHRGMLEAFVVLKFPEPEDGNVLFIESSRDFIISHDEAGEISGYLGVYEDLTRMSLGPGATQKYLENLAVQL